MAKIALFGATGTIGALVLREALGRGHEVTAMVRDPAKLGDCGAEVLRGDVLDPHSVAEAAAGRDVVVSAIGPGSGDPGMLVTAAKSLIGGVCTLGPGIPRPRVIVVGGAGSLRTPAARWSGTRRASRSRSARSCTPTERRWTSCTPCPWRRCPGPV